MSESDRIYLTFDEIVNLEYDIRTENEYWCKAEGGWMYEDMQALGDAELAYFEDRSQFLSYPKEVWVYKTNEEVMRDYKPFILKNDERAVEALRKVSSRSI